MAPKKDQRYEVNYKVLCKHGAFFYEAKITDVEEEHGEMVYTVHYQGWHKRYDERIRQSQCPEMFLPLTEANIAKAKADILEASAAKTKRKKQKYDDDDTRKSENDSRASTPSDRAGSSCHAPSIHSERRGPVSKHSDTASLTGDTGISLVGSLAIPLGPETDAQIELLCDLPDSLKKILVEEYNAIMVQGKLAVLPARVTVYNIVENYIDFSLKLFTTTGEIDVEHEGGTTRIPGVDSLCTCAKNLRDYFDVVLSYQLLYKSEKPQYQALAKREQEKFDAELARTQESPLRKARRPARDLKPTLPPAVIAQLLDGGPLRPEMIRPSKFYGLAHLLRLLVKLPVLLRLNLTNDLEFMVRIACYHDFIAFLRQNAPFILDFDLDYKVSGSA